MAARTRDASENNVGGSLVRDDVLVRLEEVRRFIKECIELAGLKKEHAELEATVLLDADRRGKSSHGLALLDMIMINISEGFIVDSEPAILRETAGSAWVDGQGCLGAVVGHFCISKAVEKATQNGIGWVTAKGSHHLGSLGWYSMQACQHGMIGLCLSNTWPATAAPGSKQRILGTNPICIAAPGLNGDYLLFDSAMTVASMRKIREKASEGDGTVPQGWGVDGGGQPTMDGASVISHGALTPLGGTSESTGGHKGFGLILLVKVLTSVLAGSAYPSDIGEKHSESVVNIGTDFGQTFIAIDPSHFGEGFSERLQHLLEYCRNSEPVNESSPIVIPGDRGRLTSLKVDKDGGLWYSKQLIHDMNARMRKLGGEYQLPS